jgi:hypothetical protein
MSRVLRGWLSGVTVGVTAGFATLEIPSLGWLLVLAFAAPAAMSESRLASIGGLLTGLGGVWIVLLGRVALTCTATGDELGCQSPGIASWLAVGGAMLGAGLLLTIMAAIRARRPGRPSV